MSERSIPPVTRAWWSATGGAVGGEVRITAALEPGAVPAEADIAVEACYAAAPSAGGGYAVAPVATLRVPVPAGAACIDVPWTVAFPAEAPKAAGSPEFRARVSIAGGPSAVTGMLSVGAVEGVCWVPPDGVPLSGPDYGAVLQAVFVPGERVGMRIDSRGLAGFTADFRIRRGGETVDTVAGVPLGPDGATAWWASDGAEAGSGAYAFDVALAHPAVDYPVQPPQQQGQSKGACPAGKRYTLEFVDPPADPELSSKTFICEEPVLLRAKATEICAGVPPVDISNFIWWLRFKKKTKDDIRREREELVRQGKGNQKIDPLIPVVFHTGPYAYARLEEPDDPPLVKITLDPEKLKEYGNRTVKSCALKPASCRAWLDRRKLLEKRKDREDVLLMARLIMNEVSSRGSSLERRCLAYVMVNRRRVRFRVRGTTATTIEEVIYQPGQIADNAGDVFFKQYPEKGDRNKSKEDGPGPGDCPECEAYRETLKIVQEVLDDPDATKEYFLTPRPGGYATGHAYYWLGVNNDPDPANTTVLQRLKEDGFLNMFWGDPRRDK